MSENAGALTTAGIAYSEGRILVAKRSAGGALSKKWEFPGGKLEPGESPEDALRREFLEELGTRVSVGEKIGETSFVHDGTSYRLEAYWVRMLRSPTIREGHTEIAWYPLEEIGELDLADSDRKLLGVIERAL